MPKYNHKVIVKCMAKDCLHIYNGLCGVGSPGWIDISMTGRCLDNAPVTNKEFKMLTGKDRKKINKEPK